MDDAGVTSAVSLAPMRSCLTIAAVEQGGRSSAGPIADADCRRVLHLLTPFDRITSRALVERQLTHGRRAGGEFARYGPAGMAKLCAGRAMSTYLLLTGVCGVVSAVSGVGVVAVLFFGAQCLLLVLAIWRLRAAAKLGYAWRSEARGT
jgi:hypothetical protein